MFERDKDQLRAAGFLIDSDETGAYTLDRAQHLRRPHRPHRRGDRRGSHRRRPRCSRTRRSPTPTTCASRSPRSPRASTPACVPAAARLADEDPARQGTRRRGALLGGVAGQARELRLHQLLRRRARLHEVEPYGLFLHDGRWYLVGRDIARDEVRTYTVARIGGALGRDRPTGDTGLRAARRLRRAHASCDSRSSTARQPTSSRRELRFERDGRVARRVAHRRPGRAVATTATARLRGACAPRSRERLLRFVIEHGPGIRVVEPRVPRVDSLRDGLEEVVRVHG